MFQYFLCFPVSCDISLRLNIVAGRRFLNHLTCSVRDGPLEITGGGVTIPKKISCKGNLSKQKVLRAVIRKTKISAEEATCIAFKVIKSMG